MEQPDERARIVAWLREQADWMDTQREGYGDDFTDGSVATARLLAKAIERGEHLPGYGADPVVTPEPGNGQAPSVPVPHRPET